MNRIVKLPDPVVMCARISCFAILLLSLLAWISALGASGSDVAKERRWAEQVIDGLLDGDEVWLKDASGHEFLGIFTEGDAESGRAVLLLHGIGVHPNWPDVIYPLRAGLYEQGITTLSIQMPILANDADPEEYLPLFAEVPGRIDAALDSLDDAGSPNVTLVAHSMGAAMAVYYLSRDPSSAVDSLVIIGMSPGIKADENIERLRQIDLPVFDLYGGKDLEPVLASASQRAAAGRAASPDYRQQRVEAANHFFQGQEAELLRQVSGWLAEQAAR
jgi:pimeloyl-ACP methyl ester carboxylesterase